VARSNFHPRLEIRLPTPRSLRKRTAVEPGACETR
jgi:hypothetical protein